VFAVAFRPDGKQVLTGSGDQTAALWDAGTGQRLRTFQGGHKGAVHAVAFHPDGKLILTGDADGKAILWDADSGQRRHTFAGHDGIVHAVAFSPDGKRALTGSADHTAILWDVDTHARLHVLTGHDKQVNAVAFNRGKFALTGSSDGKAILWDTDKGTRVSALEGHTGSVTAVAFCPANDQLLTASADRKAILWDPTRLKPVRTFQGSTRPVTALALDRETGRRVLAGSDDPAALLWDTAAGRPADALRGHAGAVLAVALDAAGKHALTGSDDHSARWWDLAGGGPLGQVPRPDAVTAVALSPDGKKAVVGCKGGDVLLCDGAGSTPRVLKGHTGAVNAVAFSPDGAWAHSGSDDQWVIVWDVAQGTRKRTLEHHGEVRALAVSRDGRRILTGSTDRTAVLWGADTGKPLTTFRDHPDRVEAVAFTSDGKAVLTASKTTATLWDAANGNSHVTFRGHSGDIRAAAVGPDDRLVLTGAEDGTVRLWDVATGDELARLVSLDGGKDWLVLTPDGLFDGSPDGREKVLFRVHGAGRGVGLVPVDRFFNVCYCPGLLTKLWLGERPVPRHEVGKKNPPVVRILSPRPGERFEKPQVTVEVEARDQGAGIRGPWLKHNGARVLAPEEAKEASPTITRRFSVSLSPGENRLEVGASSVDGGADSEPAVLTLRYEKEVPKPDLYVLAVGISEHADKSYTLKFAAADARAIEEVFKVRGPRLYREPVHVKTLLNAAATREAIGKAFEDIAAKARPEDTFVVYLAGHGVVVGGRYFFIPYEFRAREGVATRKDLEEHALSVEDLEAYEKKVAARKRIVVLDTCHSGAAIRFSTGDTFALRGAVERLNRTEGVFLIAAAPAGVEAREPEALAHGVLTYALLAGLGAVRGGPLKGEAVKPISPDGVADVLEWFLFASHHGPLLYEKLYGRPQLIEMGARKGSSFPLLPVRAP
jgi:WD40 repeat protein